MPSCASLNNFTHFSRQLRILVELLVVSFLFIKMYHTISNTEIIVLYNDERDLHQSKMGKIIAENIRDGKQLPRY